MTDARKYIIFQLVNTEQNKDKLVKIPHRTFMDLSIIYIHVPNGRLDYKNIHIIDEDIAAVNGMTEQELFDLAFENTRRILQPVIIPMRKILKDITVVGYPSLYSEIDKDVLVISNPYTFFGAASIIYEDILFGISNEVGCDLFILPSSIHECLVVPTSLFENPHDLANIVRAVNREYVEPIDRLSDNVYHYNKALRKIILCH